MITKTRVLLCALAVLAGAPAAQAAMPELEMQYHLDVGQTGDDSTSSTPDSSPNQGIATVRGASLQPGRFGNAFGLANKSWIYATGADIHPPFLTVLEWVKAPSSPGPSKYLISKGGGSCTPPAWGMYTAPAGTPNAGGAEFFVTVMGQTYAAPGVGPAQIWNGQWHLVAGTFTGTKVRFFLDGVQIGDGTPVPGQITYPTQSGGGTGSINIGGYGTYGDLSCGTYLELAGAHVDEARLYDQPLSAPELQRLAASPGPTPPTLVLDTPTFQATGVDQITNTSARLNGTIDDKGELLGYGAEYWVAGGSNPIHYVGGGVTPGIREQTQQVHITMPDLQPDTDYLVRLKVGGPSTAPIAFHTPGVATVRQDTATASIGESGDVVNLTVRRDGGSASTSTVAYATANGTATAGSDYTSTSGTLVFSPGQTGQTVEVPIADDALVEGDETFTLTLSSPTGAALGTAKTTVTITDDDQPVRLAAAALSVEESGGAAQLVVDRPGDVDTAATVDYSTSAGTATAAADYTPAEGTLSFAPGEHSKTISVPVLNDEIDEPDETFTVTLSDPAGTSLGAPSTATVTILDDDLAPDTTPPATVIALDPASPPSAGGPYLGPVTVTVSATDDRPGALQTRCVLDPATVPAGFADLPAGPCAYVSGATVGGLGPHRVYAASRDALGNTEPVVTRSFRVSRAPDTTIDSGPRGEVWRPNNLFGFSSSVAGSTFECSMDGGAFTPCTNPHATGILSQAEHTFGVRAVAPGGAVDPTPAERGFSVAAPRTVRLTCEARPAYYWLIDPWSGSGIQDKVGCQIGKLDPAQCTDDNSSRCWSPQSFGADGCPVVMTCKATTQRCPIGARCAVTTTVSWFDADKAINWGARARSTTGPIMPVGHISLDTPSLVRDCNPFTNRCTPRPNSYKECETSFNGDRCTATTTLDYLGNNAPMLSFCALFVPDFSAKRWIGPGAQLGPHSVRRIECEARWRIYPAPELATVPHGTTIQVNTLGAGILSMVATILGTPRTRAANAAAAARIAPSSVDVAGDEPATLSLVLNRAAKRLLRKKGKLRASLKLSFTGDDGRSSEKTQTVVLRRPVREPADCHPTKRPKHRPKQHPNRLPSCKKLEG